jgi:hypothetical protein
MNGPTSTTATARARVHDYTPRGDVAARLAVVSRLHRADSLAPDGHHAFLPDAIVPGDEWRCPTATERAALSGRAGHFEDADVAVVDLSAFAREPRAHLLASAHDVDRTRAAVRAPAFLGAIAGAIDELVPFCASPERIVFQGPWVSAGGMRTVTLNLDVKPPCRVGLHVDNWDDLPLPERARGRRRLCVNLGTRPRFLVFLPVPLSALATQGEVVEATSDRVSPAILVRSYLGAHLEQLAVRLQIDPGEAYVFNADDVVHDGSTATSDAPDVALHFLGHFGPPDETLRSTVAPAKGAAEAAT